MVVAFSEGLKELNVNKEDTLETAIAECSRLDFSSTDCALPMKWAMDKEKKFDVFIVVQSKNKDNFTKRGI
jgi:60 kDa SS-A/Ro ribonucleoprotein